MKQGKGPKWPGKVWRKTQYANLVRYVPSGTYFARIRIGGKLIRQSLKATSITVARLKLADLEKDERAKVETQQANWDGKITFVEALEIYRKRLEGDPNLKARTKFYHEERIKALLKSWPTLEATEIRKITKTDCLNWAAEFAKDRSGTNFNHTIGLLRKIVEIGVEAGARYDNPSRFIKRARVRSQRPELPSFDQFNKFVQEIESSGSGFSRPCADLVRFLAFGGFRKSEAANITWRDVDFERGRIVVRGDPETGTKNSEVREVPLIPEMRQLLERLREEAQEPSSEDRVMRVRECQRAMDRAAKKVGMKRITHHDLRHLFATRCIESGVDIPTVSRWLGHRDGGALAVRVYGHLRDHHSAEMAQRVRFSEPLAADNQKKS